MMMMIEKTLEMQMEMRDDWTDFISLVFASLLFLWWCFYCCNGANANYHGSMTAFLIIGSLIVNVLLMIVDMRAYIV
jgi:hypothetical protein